MRNIGYRAQTTDQFQTTRFANSVRFVFINLRTDYPAVRTCMTKVMEAKQVSSNSDERSKAGAIKNTIRNVNSWVFCLCLSGCADIYDLFGVFSQILQEVDVLPFERYDKAQAVLAKYVKMLECIDNHKECPPDEPEKKKCLWPRYHEDITSMKETKKYIGVAISHINMGSGRQTRLQSSSDELQLADGLDLVKERLKTLVWRIQNDL